MSLTDDMADEAKAWRQENGEVPPEPPKSEPVPEQQERAEEPAAPVSAKAREQSNAALAVFAVGLVDMLAQHLVGPRMKLAPEEKAELASLAEPVLDKYLPEVEVGPEVALLVGAAFIYGPKYLSPEPAKRDGTPAGGAAQADAGSSGQPAAATTEATVDGRSVTAEILDFRKAGSK